MNLRLKPLAMAFGGLFAIMFAICFFWGYAIPSDLLELHTNLMKLSFLGYTGLNFLSFLYAFIQSYIWGIITGLIFWRCYYHCDKWFK